MKLHTLTLILLAVSGLCFKQGIEEAPKERGTLFATVDGRYFKLQEGQLFRGILVEKSPSMDGRTPGKNVISTSFTGRSYDKDDKTPFTESVSMDMSYEEDKLGEPATYTVALQYNSTDYAMIKEKTKINITKMTWEADHKHFRLWADFDCMMRSWGYPNDNKKDVNLKGHMSNIRITVPSWYTAK